MELSFFNSKHERFLSLVGQPSLIAF